VTSSIELSNTVDRILGRSKSSIRETVKDQKTENFGLLWSDFRSKSLSPDGQQGDAQPIGGFNGTEGKALTRPSHKTNLSRARISTKLLKKGRIRQGGRRRFYESRGLHSHPQISRWIKGAISGFFLHEGRPRDRRAVPSGTICSSTSKFSCPKMGRLTNSAGVPAGFLRSSSLDKP